MRVLIKFKNKEKPQFNQYQLQSLVYSLIKKAGFEKIHQLDQNQPRFFNFSQLFFDNQNQLSLIISSPIKELILNINSLFKKDLSLSLNQKELFVLQSKAFEQTFKRPVFLKTETPIIVRVPKDNFSKYQLNLDKNYSYFYWRPKKDVPFEPFIKQLEDRVWKNYKLFTGKEPKEEPIFSRFIFKKTIDLPYFKKGKKISRIGTLWEFEINHQIGDNIIRFILDTGLGELTSQGYGFVNIKF